MSKSKFIKRDLYYTNDHEWIDFQGTVAYIGVCQLKLSGVNRIQKIAFAKGTGSIKKGEVIATLQGNGCRVPVHMPADGKIIRLNETLQPADYGILLEQPENNGWIAYIGLTRPYERNGLMTPDQYKLFTKKKS